MGQKGTEKDRTVGKNVMEGRRTDGNRWRWTENVREQNLRNKLLPDLLGYIDDNFSFEEEGKVIWYAPYHCYYPSKQAALLCLWDEIGLPHEKAKQEYAPVLQIVGFMVDPNLMRVSMDETDKDKLTQHIKHFMVTTLEALDGRYRNSSSLLDGSTGPSMFSPF